MPPLAVAQKAKPMQTSQHIVGEAAIP